MVRIRFYPVGLVALGVVGAFSKPSGNKRGSSNISCDSEICKFRREKQAQKLSHTQASTPHPLFFEESSRGRGKPWDQIMGGSLSTVAGGAAVSCGPQNTNFDGARGSNDRGNLYHRIRAMPQATCSNRCVWLGSCILLCIYMIKTTAAATTNTAAT